MSTEAFEFAQAVLLSIGGGAALIFTLSSFLGKVWAERILLSVKTLHEKEVTEFRNKLETLAQQKSHNYKEKLELYKVVSVPLVELVALLSKEQGLTHEHVEDFDRQRLHITVQLALFAPQNVFSSFNDLIDYLSSCLENDKYTFSEFRIKALAFLSEMRKDIGIYTDNVEYRGSR